MDQLATDTTVVESPAVGNRQTRRVALTQVVVVRITLGGEIVDPNERAPVLIGKSGDGRSRTPGSGALTSHRSTR